MPGKHFDGGFPIRSEVMFLSVDLSQLGFMSAIQIANRFVKIHFNDLKTFYKNAQVLRNEKLQGTACDEGSQRRIYKRSNQAKNRNVNTNNKLQG